ncbi:protein sidekick-2-like [Ixodes scapularis]|uniref:protein sidekick-2-like n=1 Tax=Ixodes scapularis TaxID=6945 RepID=UPI001A9D6469|nr:protein sidekick-2-like [Ixodes scapularis]
MSYSVNVYPVTFLGRAPFNSSVEARTEQGDTLVSRGATLPHRIIRLVPGPVADLTVAWVNSSEALVTWQSPKVRNGTPVEFKVKLHPRDVGGCGVTGLEDVFLVRYPQFLGRGLAPHSLYRVGVSAGTSKGYGEQRELNFLTTGAAPSGPPRNVKVIWAGPRSLFLSWEPVPCREMHGPLVFYECTFKFADGTGNVLATNATGKDANYVKPSTFLNPMCGLVA